MRELENFNGKKLGMGCMRLPVLDGDTEKIDEAAVCKMVDYFMEQGFSYFDTAYPYHNQMSEGAIKRCLVERYDRDKFYLADKMPMWLAKETADVLDKILNEHPEMEFVQLQINYYDWGSENVQSGKCYEVAVKHGVPVIVMEPVKGGTLANLAPEAASVLDALNPDENGKSKASYASFAVRYAASLENVCMVLSGMSDFAQLSDNVSYMKDFISLTEEEQAGITKVVEELAKLPTIPCTKCRYCVEGCPQKINIPALFQAYNNVIQFGDNTVSRRSYTNAVAERGLASSCIECGMCEEQCPQHLEIRTLLKDVTKMFE